MYAKRVTMLAGLCALALAACAPASAFPAPMPTPGGDWHIRLLQTGGFAGVHLSIEASSAGQMTAPDERSNRTVTRPLSAATVQELSRLVAQVSVPSTQSLPSVCADCFIYQLEIASASGVIRVEADDVTLSQSRAQPLVQFLGELRDQALQSAN